MREVQKRRKNLAHAALVLAALTQAANAEPATREQQLERLVRQDCGSCHGMTLKGGLGPALLSERLSAAEPQAVAAIILDGVPGTPMPPWRGLITDDDALWIAHYLRKETHP